MMDNGCGTVAKLLLPELEVYWLSIGKNI